MKKQNKNTQYPYGRCECPSPCDCIGPAAYSVKRDGKTLKLCTRCDLLSDTERKLLVKRKDPAETFRKWDALGFMCIALELAEKRESRESPPGSDHFVLASPPIRS